MKFRLGSLPKKRWVDYRRLRLEALKDSSAAFGGPYGEEARYPPETWKGRIGDCIFALSKGMPVGMISVVFSDRAKTRHVAHVHAFYVSPAYRLKGVGRALVGAALSRARRRGGVMKLRLDVNPDFRAALYLYQEAGFRVTGRAKGELKVGRKFCDLLSMELWMGDFAPMERDVTSQ